MVAIDSRPVKGLVRLTSSQSLRRTNSVMASSEFAASIVVRFGSKEDLETGSATLDAMSPPDDSGMRRVSVDKFEVVLERDAP